MNTMNLTVYAAALFVVAVLTADARADAWPAEPIGSAINLTSIEGPGINDFHEDLSGAYWNAETEVLWVCRNGPTGASSKLWAIERLGNGTYAIDERDGLRGEWTGFGDLEGITQRPGEPDVIFMIVEGANVIRSFDVSVYGTATLEDEWDIDALMPDSGGNGSEALTFIDNASLLAGGFVDAAGAPRQGTMGLGGLMLVGHQNGGALFAFDLGSGGTFDFVGEYRTARTETAGLEFDVSTGTLFAYHDSSIDILGAYGLGSTPIAGQSARQLAVMTLYDGPSSGNNEGIALLPTSDCDTARGGRRFAMTVDDAGPNSLYVYEAFALGCDDSCPADINNDGAVTFADILQVIGLWGPCGGCPADLDGDGMVGFGDVLVVIGMWGVCP